MILFSLCLVDIDPSHWDYQSCMLWKAYSNIHQTTYRHLECPKLKISELKETLKLKEMVDLVAIAVIVVCLLPLFSFFAKLIYFQS